MKTSRVLQFFACIALAALGICGQPALAQESHHRLFMVVPRAAAQGVVVAPERAPRPTIYPLQATFTQINATEYPNADGTDLWPCFGFGSAAAPNVDCPTVGDPSVPLPVGGVVLGALESDSTGYGARG